MTQENSIETKTKSQIWYSKLDRFLLYLLSAELGYFILLILVGVIMAVLNFAFHLSLSFLNGIYVSRDLWPVLLYTIALPLNTLGGFASILLNIQTRHEGYPGTGHLLNWILLISTAWLFILAVVYILQTIASRY